MKELTLMLSITGLLLSAIALAEAEKLEDRISYHQKLLDLHIASVTTKHKVTCNDDIIEGYCVKTGKYLNEI